MSDRKDGPYQACHSTQSGLYGVDGPGPGLGYYAAYGYPQNFFGDWETAEKVARMMNTAFREGKLARSREIKELLG